MSKAAPTKRGPSAEGKLYLACYNALQCVGWGFILVRTLGFLLQNKCFHGLWPQVALPVEFFQTLALLEVVHCLVGLVATSPFLTLIQILSRLMVVWGILVPVPESQNQYGIVMLLVAWCLAEITRYAFYGATLYNSCPFFLAWCRVVQLLPRTAPVEMLNKCRPPLSGQGEIVTMIAALPYIRQRGLFSIALPNLANFSFDYHTAVILIIASYVPFFPQLFGHLLKQRGKFLAPKTDEKQH
ncbi:hypothetical protein HPB47_000314 [Ixodes persulcatus]|uniref:Uncharacterized protein n=1 Tax=Ixodes persulcatus TaxID=34615 RepID=A0AC60PSE6_IXOPE|nr:hypothetical protein HPB47_000314 [Ixodes persulcatus]